LVGEDDRSRPTGGLAEGYTPRSGPAGHSLEGFEDLVGDGGGFGGGADVVGADDVGAGEDGGHVSCGGGVEAIFDGWYCAFKQDRERGVLREGVGEEGFAGDADEDGQVELVELGEVGEERVVFVEALAEAEAGVEDDLVA
jgi:hypothetical protein